MEIKHFKEKVEYEYLFHDLIDSEDHQTRSFSNESIGFHDRFYCWKKKPVMYILDNNEVTSALFYNLTNDKYVSIINILTPIKYRKKGYAKVLMAEAIKKGYNIGMRRLRMNADNIPGTISFYNKLNCLYLGVTKSNALYCNIPLLSGDIEDFSKLKDLSMEELMDEKSTRLTTRRLCPDLSSKLYDTTSEYIDLSRYKHKEFLTYRGLHE